MVTSNLQQLQFRKVNEYKKPINIKKKETVNQKNNILREHAEREKWGYQIFKHRMHRKLNTFKPIAFLPNQISGIRHDDIASYIRQFPFCTHNFGTYLGLFLNNKTLLIEPAMLFCAFNLGYSSIEILLFPSP